MIYTPADVTPEALTVLLRQAGALPQGQVARVDWRPHQPAGEPGSRHALYFLDVQYQGVVSSLAEPGSVGGLPPRLFLKFGSSSKEHFFYTRIAPALKIPGLPRCYFAGYDDQAERTCLLLEDLSGTHFQTEWPLPPSAALCRQTVDRLAEIHAKGWENPLLESDFRPALPPGRSWADRVALAVENLHGFLDFLGDRLSPSRRAVFERVLSSRRPWEIPPGASGLALVHGDMHFWNVFFPLVSIEAPLAPAPCSPPPCASDPGDIRFIDWNMWDIGRVTDDLAYLIALHWYPERRARLERDLLQRYVHHLGECGITSYTLDTLYHDYQISVIRALFIPVWQWVRGIQPAVWWPHLERGMLAFEDLGCGGVL